MLNNDLGSPDVGAEEDVMKLRIIAQKKEKKIKIIRMLTVFAYLLSVSTVASTLSAYYIFVWNPYAGNDTRKSDPDGMVMALRRDNDRYSANGNFITEVVNSPKSDGRTTIRPESSVQFQSTTIKCPTSRTVVGNVSESLTVTDDKL